jgi:hypothetical protein
MLSSLRSSGRARANGVTAGLTNQQDSRVGSGEPTKLLLPDKRSRASAGARASRAGNPDRPARRQAHWTGAIAASPERSPSRTCPKCGSDCGV